jgi:hypothetical protein
MSSTINMLNAFQILEPSARAFRRVIKYHFNRRHGNTLHRAAARDWLQACRNFKFRSDYNAIRAAVQKLKKGGKA